MKTSEAAAGKWYGILRNLGVDDSFLRDKHGPCPLCGGGKDRFRWDDKGGSGSFFCNSCGSGDGMKFAMLWTGREFKDVAKEIDGMVGNLEQVFKDTKPDPKVWLNAVAARRAPIDSINPVRSYLNSRGLKPVQGIEYCESIRYWHDGQATNYPAMVCLIRDASGSPLSWHVTHLTATGEKASVDPVRKILPPVRALAGSAIRLGGMAESIGIAEGIETALAVSQTFGIVCWSAMNATLLEKFTPPEGIKSVCVYGDNDANYTGQKAAYTLAHRLRDTVSVDVRLPGLTGTDFADELNLSRAVAI